MIINIYKIMGICMSVLGKSPLNRDEVLIAGEQWTEEISLQVKGLTHWRVRQLRLFNNYRATLVKEIAHIHFTALTWLNLEGNEISSVEGLPRMKMLQISSLFLSSNRITSVGVIRKADWPRLGTLDLSYNHLIDAKRLGDGSFPSIEQLLLFISGGKNDQNRISRHGPSPGLASSLKYLSIRKGNLFFDRSFKKSRERMVLVQLVQQ